MHESFEDDGVGGHSDAFRYTHPSQENRKKSDSSITFSLFSLLSFTSHFHVLVFSKAPNNFSKHKIIS